MTLGGRIGLPVVFAAVAALSITVAWLGLGPVMTAGAIPAAVLAVLMFARLRHGAYSAVAAGVVCASFFAQPGLAQHLMLPDGPVWLALVVFALAASGADAVTRPGVRPIIALGVSLAVVQAIDPIGVYIVAAIVPILVSLPQLRANGAQAVTLAVLVLFVPIVAAVLLREAPALALPSILTALGLRSAAVPAPISPFALISAVGAAIPFLLLPTISRTLRTPASVFAAMLTLLVIAAFALTAVLGARREAYWLAATVMPLAAVIASALKPAPSRERLVIMTSLLSLSFSWAAWSV
jgi:hypothetical protein